MLIIMDQSLQISDSLVNYMAELRHIRFILFHEMFFHFIFLALMKLYRFFKNSLLDNSNLRN